MAGGLEVCVVVTCVGDGFAECEVDVGAAAAGASDDAAAPSGVPAAVGVGPGTAAVRLGAAVVELELTTPAPALWGKAVFEVDDSQADAARTVIAQAKADAHRCRSMGSPPDGPTPAAGQGLTLAEFRSNRNA